MTSIFLGGLRGLHNLPVCVSPFSFSFFFWCVVFALRLDLWVNKFLDSCFYSSLIFSPGRWSCSILTEILMWSVEMLKSWRGEGKNMQRRRKVLMLTIIWVTSIKLSQMRLKLKTLCRICWWPIKKVTRKQMMKLKTLCRICWWLIKEIKRTQMMS